MKAIVKDGASTKWAAKARKLGIALASTAALGLRHGFDYDHIAAISDITSVEPKPARSMRLGVLYALGHAATIAILGSAVIVGRFALPSGLNEWAERIIGCTLIVLAIYVCFTMFSKQHSHNPRSRIVLLISAGRWLFWRISSFVNPEVERPASFRWSYNRSSVFLIGVVHGLGAETPTQLSLFLLAANLGGMGKGLLGLGMFIVGLLMMNTLMTASATGLYGAGAHRPKLNLWVSGLTAAYSFGIGIIFLLGASAALPALAGN
jgi:high-affinity nickel-transport protein